MSVYTLKMNFIDKPDSFNFCKNNNLVGFGWGIPDCYGEIKSIEAYKTVRKQNGLYKSCRELTRSMNLLETIQANDYIWTIDLSAYQPQYYLCKSTGEYKHLTEDYANKYGLANCMVCKFVLIGNGDIVPEEVKRYLHSDGIVYNLSSKKQQSVAELLYEEYKLLCV